MKSDNPKRGIILPMHPNSASQSTFPAPAAAPALFQLTRQTDSPAQTETLARQFAKALPTEIKTPFHIHLSGTLGAGKTLWAKCLIDELGGGAACSPTFALVLSYVASATETDIHHIDMFRLPQDAPLPEELREFLNEPALCLVEWTERAPDMPAADISLHIHYADNDKRQLKFAAHSQQGEQCLRDFA